MKIEIYQMPANDPGKFLSFDTQPLAVVPERYQLMYAGEVADGVKPEEVFHAFNSQPPVGFMNHSLLVSDVLSCNGIPYFVDVFGLRSLTEFDRREAVAV